MQADNYIPRRIDDQWKLGFWDIDVAAPVLFCMFLGWLAGTKVTFGLALLLGVYIARWMKQMKADRHPAIVLHFLYWHLPSTPLTSLKATPPSDIDRMIG